MKYVVLISVTFKVRKDFLPISTHKSKKKNHRKLCIEGKERRGEERKGKERKVEGEERRETKQFSTNSEK